MVLALRHHGKIHCARSTRKIHCGTTQQINRTSRTAGVHPQMASVEEVRAGIAQANQQANESMAALQQASSALEQAQSSLSMVTQGSGQPDAEQATGLLA